MKKPILVVMAAGMGSRYGGLKQMDPVGRCGEVIMDYSLYDAHRAGFEKVIFIIKHTFEDVFKEKIGNHIAEYMEVAYAFQDLNDLPDGYAVPEGREKPWGTCHAILAARDLIDAPFAVINADDYYGTQCFRIIYDYLSTHRDDDKYRYCMVGYLLKNTVTANGSVARGVCSADADGNLISVVERTKIEPYADGIHFTEDDGETWTDLDENTVVSMNLWGFSESFVAEAGQRFSAFLDNTLLSNPLKGEYFLPSVVTQLLEEEKATVQVLPCPDKWYGVTYREDKPDVVKALDDMTEAGIYPSPLWKQI
ncbi:MAG: nucleotidyltransferase [Clostridiales bacterium]|nr:nucleotidyltransferase [Clostridiales bacterium]